MRSMGHPEYAYSPWTTARKAAARERALRMYFGIGDGATRHPHPTSVCEQCKGPRSQRSVRLCIKCYRDILPDRRRHPRQMHQCVVCRAPTPLRGTLVHEKQTRFATDFLGGFLCKACNLSMIHFFHALYMGWREAVPTNVDLGEQLVIAWLAQIVVKRPDRLIATPDRNPHVAEPLRELVNSICPTNTDGARAAASIPPIPQHET